MAASMYGVAFTASPLERTSRVVPGMRGTAIAIITLLTEPPSAATRARASTSEGNENIMSMSRWSRLSMAPPKYALPKPSSSPIPVPAAVATTPTYIEMRAP